MKISKQGIELIKFFESLHDGNLSKIGLQPKLCPANIVTIGYGRALKDKKGNWLKGEEGLTKALELYPEWETITKEEAEQFLYDDLKEFESKINSLKLDFKQNEFDALVSFSYNLGFGSLLKSTLLKRIKDKQGDIKEAFLMWNKSVGKVLSGLTKRREAEAELFLNNKLII